MGTTWDQRLARSPRTPVIVGVGTASQWVDEPGGGDDAIALMVAAARRAIADAGVAGIGDEIGRVSIPAGSWAHTDPGAEVARRLGLGEVGRTLVQVGIPQQVLFNDAYERLAAGETDAVLIVGGEAARRAAIAARAGVELDDPLIGGTADDFRLADFSAIVTEAEMAAGLWDPPGVYALLDDARRAADGLSPDERRTAVAELWAGFNAVAATNPDAAFPTPRSASWLREPGDENRLIAFPYNKWHCSQINVDQAAALVVMSIEGARRLGVDPERLVAPVVALHSSSAVPVLARRDLGSWPAMGVLGDAATAHLGRRVAEAAAVDLYSCFPIAVGVQQRALGLAPDAVPTITGGMTFAGGPWNSYVLQSTAAMVDRLRSSPGVEGVVTSVSGFVHKPGLAVYSTDPDGPEPLVADLADRAADATEVAPTTTDHDGPARVVAATIRRVGLERRVTVIAETDDGTRVIGLGVDDDLADAVVSRGLVGDTVHVAGTALTA